MKDEEQLCPRRSESGGLAAAGVDYWQYRHGKPHRSCSYCGSVHPEDFLAAAIAGCKLGATDKSYKSYIDMPQDPTLMGELVVVGASNGPHAEADGWTKYDHEQHEVILRRSNWRVPDNGENAWYMFAPRGPVIHDKFYFQHLSPEQQQQFIDLYNAKKLNYGDYPLYVLPFFASRK